MARQEVGGPGWLALGLKERGQHLGLRKPLGPQVSESLAEPFPLFYSLVIGASLFPGLFVERTSCQDAFFKELLPVLSPPGTAPEKSEVSSTLPH